MGVGGHLLGLRKKSIPFPKVDGKRIEPEAAKALTLEDVKKVIEAAK